LAWTDPPDWASGAVLTSAQLDTYLTANTQYLYNTLTGTTFSGTQVARTANQSIATSNDENVSWDQENWDVGGWYTSGTTITVPSGAIPSGFTTIGILAICLGRFESNATGKRRIELLKNGSSYETLKLVALDDDATTMSFSAVTTAASGDNFKMNVWQNSGGSLNITLARLTIVRLGVAA